jgi:hypothetical protein
MSELCLVTYRKIRPFVVYEVQKTVPAYRAYHPVYTISQQQPTGIGKTKENEMNHSHEVYRELIKQHYDKLAKEAHNTRLIHNLVSRSNPTRKRKEVNIMLKRRFAIVATIAIITAILIAQNVAAAVGAGGGIKLVL